MILSLDVGATNTKVGEVKEGNILNKITTRTPRDFEEFLRFLEEIMTYYENVDKLAIAIAGQVDMEKGILKHAPNIGWKDIEFVKIIKDKFKKEVVLINDARAITYGEYMVGGLKGVGNGICVYVGTGIGGGVIIDGEIRFGCDYNMGEIGHMKIKPDGLRCTCGKKGCLEAYVGGYGLTRYLKQLDYTRNLKALSAKKDDPVSKKVFERFVFYMSYGLASLINVFNPCKIVLGGGVMMGFGFLIDEIEKEAKSLAIDPNTEHLTIELSTISKDAGILGAYYYAFNNIKT